MQQRTRQPEMDKLRRRRQMARRMGGANKVKRQHVTGGEDRLDGSKGNDQLYGPTGNDIVII